MPDGDGTNIFLSNNRDFGSEECQKCLQHPIYLAGSRDRQLAWACCCDDVQAYFDLRQLLLLLLLRYS